MPIDPNNPASATVGSAGTGPTITPSTGAAGGQPVTAGAVVETVPKSIYDQLETKMGTMGNELGQYRSFYESITPLLDKLEKAPELVQAIMDGKVTGDLAKAVIDGKVQIGDANAVAQAAASVQSDPTNKGKSPEEIEALIEQKMQTMRNEFEEKTQLSTFEQETQKFIDSTPDFTDLAPDISKWLDQHDVTDIRVAYYAVKGEKADAAAREGVTRAAGEAARDLVSGASGGNSPARFTGDSAALVDQLISGRPDPNRIGGF